MISKIFSNRGYTVSYVFFAVLICFLNSGNFFGPFLTDESYFMQSAWNVHSEIIKPIDAYIPQGYPSFLDYGLSVFDSDIIFFSFVRILNLILSLSLFVIISVLIGHVYHKNGNYYLSIIFSFLFVQTIIGMRGFELRPEAIGNVLIVLSYIYIFSHSNHSIVHRMVYLSSCIFMFSAVFFSTRYVIPLLFIWFLATIKYSQKDRFSYVVIICVVVGSILFLLSLYNVNDINRVIEKSTLINEYRSPMSIRDKIFSLGFGKLTGHIPELKYFPFISGVRLLNFILFSILFIFCMLKTKENKEKVIIFLSAMAYYSSLVFLFILDYKPFNYAVTHEFIFFLMSSLVIIDATKIKVDLIFFIKLFVFSYLFIPSVLSVWLIKPKLDMVFYSSLDLRESQVKSLELKQLIELKKDLKSKTSFLNQIKLMKKICERFQGEEIYIFSKTYNNHPICINDLYTYRWFVHMADYENVRENIESISTVLYKDESYIIYK